MGTYENDAHALGYTYQFYLDRLTNHDQIKVLSIDNVAPSPENVRSGSYPFTISYWGTIRAGEERKPAGLFLDWMISPEGQRVIAQAGYLPMTDSSGAAEGDAF